DRAHQPPLRGAATKNVRLREQMRAPETRCIHEPVRLEKTRTRVRPRQILAERTPPHHSHARGEMTGRESWMPRSAPKPASHFREQNSSSYSIYLFDRSDMELCP